MNPVTVASNGAEALTMLSVVGAEILTWRSTGRSGAGSITGATDMTGAGGLTGMPAALPIST
jgi:hypothetical protein